MIVGILPSKGRLQSIMGIINDLGEIGGELGGYQKIHELHIDAPNNEMM